MPIFFHSLLVRFVIWKEKKQLCLFSFQITNLTKSEWKKMGNSSKFHSERNYYLQNWYFKYVKYEKKVNCFLEFTLNCLSFGLFWPCCWFNFRCFLHSLQDNASFETNRECMTNSWIWAKYIFIKVQVNNFQKVPFSQYLSKHLTDYILHSTQYCHVESMLKFFDKIVYKKRDFLKIINL